MKYQFAPMKNIALLAVILWTTPSFAQSSCFELFKLSRAQLDEMERGTTETLMALIEDGHPQSIAWLVQTYKLDINKKDEFGNSPLRLAITNKNMAVIESLLSYPELQMTAELLHHALRSQNTHILWIMLNHSQADVNSRDKWGNTLLHAAVETRNIAAIDLLYTFPTLRGNALNNRGQSARDLAVQQKDSDLILKLNRFRR